MIMPTAIIFLAVGRNGLARPCAARRGHLCRLPTEAAFPVILPVPFAAAAPHSPEGGQALTNQEIIPCPPYSRSASSLLFSGSSCALFRIENLSNGSVASLLQCQARAQLLRVGLREFWTASSIISPKHRTFTNAKGEFVFFGSFSGPATVQAAGVTRAVSQLHSARTVDFQLP
jgi:hypothetical protein